MNLMFGVKQFCLKFGMWRPVSILLILLLSLVVLLHDKNVIITSHDHTDHEGHDCIRSSQPISDERPSEHNHNIAKYKGMYLLGDLNVYFYRAFLDDRISPNIIRVFGLQNKGIDIKNYTCSWISLKNGVNITWQTQARWEYIDKSWPDWSLYFAIQLECDLSRSTDTSPSHVILSVTTSNELQVEIPVEKALESTKKLPLAVCVKPITGQFYVSRLVEWMEIQRLVGLENFILYTTDITGASRYVIEYYRELGLVDTVQFPFLSAVLSKVEENNDLSPEERYAVYQQVYLVALQDALYRFYKMYKLLLVIDLDEVVLPSHGGSLVSTIEDLVDKTKDGAGFLFQTAWHFQESNPVDGIPNYLYMQQYAQASVPVVAQPKSVLVTSRTRTLNFHAVISALNATYRIQVLVPWEDCAYVHHYRGYCSAKFVESDCKDILAKSQLDTVIPRYLSPLKDRVRKIIDHLQLM